jgi:tetratricopeptide repeat protein
VSAPGRGLAQAIRHALAGNDVGRAADLMEIAIPAMHRDRREGELARWVDALPAEVVRARPVLGVAFAGALAQVSAFDSVGRRLSDVELSLRPEGGPWPEQPPPGLVVVDDYAYRSLPGSVAMYRAALALASGDLDATVTQAREALSLAPPDDSLIRAGAAALAGLASWAQGDLASAHVAYEESVTQMRRIGYIADVLGLCITLGDLRRTQGRLGDALRTYEQALELAAATPGAGVPPLRGTADMRVGIAEVLLDRDDRAGAAEHLAVSDRTPRASTRSSPSAAGGRQSGRPPSSVCCGGAAAAESAGSRAEPPHVRKVALAGGPAGAARHLGDRPRRRPDHPSVATSTIFGGWTQLSMAGTLCALPVAVFEFSVGLWLTFKGFKPDATVASA